MELKRIDTLLFKALYLVAAGILVCQIFGWASLTRMLFLLTFPLTVLLWFRSLRKTATAGDVFVFVTAAIAVVNVLINAGVNNASLSFNYIKKLVMFIMCLLFLQTAYRVRINEELFLFINRLVDLLTLLMVAMYFTQPAKMHLLNGQVTQYLTFRFSNPNLTALFLCCLYMLKLYRLFTPDRWYVKLGDIAMAVALGWFVIATRSRNCLLVMLIFTVFSGWLIFRGKGALRIGRGWATLFAVFPALFLAGYMILIVTPWIQGMLSFLVDEGKGLDSRVEIWSNALSTLWRSPVIGAYYEASYGSGNFQLHNSHLDIAVSYGIPVMIAVCALLIRYLYQNGRRYDNKSSYIYILGFACAILLGLGEAAVFSGGLGIYVYAGTFLLLANHNDASHNLRSRS